MSYRVCIPTAGTGSRLGNLTRYINKSLVGIANRPVLSHFIEFFPEDTEFVIALGHKGHLVREFLGLAYPDRTFFFSEVSPYEGPGSGLGLSLLSCRNYLKEPFVFISCDTLVKEPVPAPDHNWMGYAHVSDLAQYRTVGVEEGRVTGIYEKGEPGNHLQAYIGLAGIHDHELFWDSMESGSCVAIGTGEVHGLRWLLKSGVRAYGFTWHDTGNPLTLEKTREAYRESDAPNILDKPNEAIWFIGDSVVKFSDDREFIRNRVERVRHLGGYTPDVVNASAHMYCYRKIKGNVLSEVVTLPLFQHLLDGCKGFWEFHELRGESALSFRKTCLRFYRDKTAERIKLFYRTFQKSDGNETINGEAMPTMDDLLNAVNWEWISEGWAGRFHGDFHFENILWAPENERFVFLDWRQEFGGSLDTGDIYYDFAKLMHGLIISHELITKNQYWTKWANGEIRYDFHRKQLLVECERYFEDWLAQNGFDVKKVRTLTALIYLNIAALHHYPYCLLLYSLGKRMLKQELEKN